MGKWGLTEKPASPTSSLRRVCFRKPRTAQTLQNIRREGLRPRRNVTGILRGSQVEGKWHISHFGWDALSLVLNLNSYPCIFEVIIERNAIFICRMHLNLIYENIIDMTLPWQLPIFHNGRASPSFHFISFCLHNIAWALSESSQDNDANLHFITKPREIALL